jgi:hypothetical protein
MPPARAVIRSTSADATPGSTRDQLEDSHPAGRALGVIIDRRGAELKSA